RGGYIVGLCGGYQMLGKTISDPDGIEGKPETINGLGLLNIETKLIGDKTLTNVSGTCFKTNTEISGYEIHIGQTSGPDCPAGPSGMSGFGTLFHKVQIHRTF
ncbi:MAG: hypothetical protein DSY83_09100, partial [Flavobacteriia bacterium]